MYLEARRHLTNCKETCKTWTSQAKTKKLTSGSFPRKKLFRSHKTKNKLQKTSWLTLYQSRICKWLALLKLNRLLKMFKNKLQLPKYQCKTHSTWELCKTWTSQACQESIQWRWWTTQWWCKWLIKWSATHKPSNKCFKTQWSDKHFLRTQWWLEC